MILLKRRGELEKWEPGELKPGAGSFFVVKYRLNCSIVDSDADLNFLLLIIFLRI